MSRRFLVLHGWENRRPPEHWQWWLVDALRTRGEQALYPQLPDPDRPAVEDWLDTLAAEWRQMGAGERVVVAHSLGCLLWLHAAGRGLVRPLADRVLLVAPPSPAVTAQTPAMASFVVSRRPAELGTAEPSAVRLVCSDRDEYSTEGTAQQMYGDPLGIDSEVLRGAGHLTIDDGYGPWPAALDWCLDGSTRFAPPSPPAAR